MANPVGDAVNSLEKLYIFRVNAKRPAAQAIELAAMTIRAGGLVAFPTETVYGLGANAWEEEAVEKIFRAKGRPANDPLIVHIASFDQLKEVAREIPDVAWALGRRFWPGALTLVLKKSAELPANLTAGLDTVAVRMPDHAVATALLNEAKVPIAAPSANRFSRPSPTTAEHVLDDLADDLDVLLDAGSTPIGVESTILSLVDGPAQVLRPGGVSLEALRELVPDVRFESRFVVDDGKPVPAPGSMLKHYSPKARVLLFQGEDDAAVYAAMREQIARHTNVGVLTSDYDAAAFKHDNVTIIKLGSNAEQAALRLFAAMRTLDKAGVELILARAPDKQGLGLAVWDRLLRASAGSLIEV